MKGGQIGTRATYLSTGDEDDSPLDQEEISWNIAQILKSNRQGTNDRNDEHYNER